MTGVVEERRRERSMARLSTEARNGALLGVCAVLFGLLVTFGLIAWQFIAGLTYGELREIAGIGLLGSILLGLFLGVLHYACATWGE